MKLERCAICGCYPKIEAEVFEEDKWSISIRCEDSAHGTFIHHTVQGLKEIDDVVESWNGSQQWAKKYKCDDADEASVTGTIDIYVVDRDLDSFRHPLFTPRF